MRRGMLADLEFAQESGWYIRVGKAVTELPLARFRELGFTNLEIYAGLNFANPDARKYLADFAARAKRTGVTVYSIHVPFDKDISVPDAGPRETALSDIKTAIITAKETGAKFAIVHPGRQGTKEELDARVEQSVASLLLLNAFCRDNGVRMAVENMLPGGLGNGAAELAAIVGRLPAEAGVCLDTGHAFVTDKSPASALAVLGSRLLTMHVHDNDGKQDLHLVPGLGGIDWKPFIDGLMAMKFAGVFMLEVGNKLPTVETLEMTASFCNKHFPST